MHFWDKIPVCLKLLSLTEVSSRFMPEKATIFIFSLFQFALINDYLNNFSSIRVNYMHVNSVRVTGCTS